METLETKKEKNLSKPLLVAGIILALSWGCYVTFLVTQFEYIIFDWTFLTTALDFLGVLALATMVIITAFKPSRIKYLAIPIFAIVAIALYTMIRDFVDYGFVAADAYYWFKNITLVIAYILFGIYAIKKSIAIVFSSIFITISSVFGLWYNIEQIFAVIRQEMPISILFWYLMLAFLLVGVLVLIWVCCVLFPPKTQNKDIIKKNIALSLILSVITLGVYAVFWVKSITEDAAKLEGVEINSSFETALFFVLPFFAIYWLYDMGKKMAKLAEDADMSWLYGVQGFFMLCYFAMALIQGQIHKAIGLHK